MTFPHDDTPTYQPPPPSMPPPPMVSAFQPPPPTAWNAQPSAPGVLTTQPTATVGRRIGSALGRLAAQASIFVLGASLFSNGLDEISNDLSRSGAFGGFLACIATSWFFGGGTFAQLGRVIRGKAGLTDAIFAGSAIHWLLISIAAAAGSMYFLWLSIAG